MSPVLTAMRPVRPLAAAADDAAAILESLGVRPPSGGPVLVSRSPITGEAIGEAAITTPDEAAAKIAEAHRAFLAWRQVPAPRRGELIRSSVAGVCAPGLASQRPGEPKAHRRAWPTATLRPRALRAGGARRGR